MGPAFCKSNHQSKEMFSVFITHQVTVMTNYIAAFKESQRKQHFMSNTAYKESHIAERRSIKQNGTGTQVLR